MSLINKARKNNQPKVNEQKEVSISALLNSSESSKQASPQKSPVAVTPAEPVESLMPPPKKQLPIIGNQTMQLLQKLRKKGTCQQDPQTRLQDLLHSQQKVADDMALKHRELTQPGEAQLVLPLKYKVVLQALANIDSSLDYLKKCRKQNGWLDVQNSVKSTFKKDVSLNELRRLLALDSDLYRYGYQQQAKLWIDVRGDLAQLQKTRYDKVQKMLLEKVISEFKHWCQERSIDAAPYLREKVWHDDFDPHDVPDLLMAELEKPQQPRSESVQSMLSRSALQPCMSEVSTMVTDPRLAELSERTGISIQTLRMVKSVENSQTQRQKSVD